MGHTAKRPDRHYKVGNPPAAMSTVTRTSAGNRSRGGQTRNFDRFSIGAHSQGDQVGMATIYGIMTKSGGTIGANGAISRR